MGNRVSLWSPGWPWIRGFLASISATTGLQVCAIAASFCLASLSLVRMTEVFFKSVGMTWDPLGAGEVAGSVGCLLPSSATQVWSLRCTEWKEIIDSWNLFSDFHMCAVASVRMLGTLKVFTANHSKEKDTYLSSHFPTLPLCSCRFSYAFVDRHMYAFEEMCSHLDCSPKYRLDEVQRGCGSQAGECWWSYCTAQDIGHRSWCFLNPLLSFTPAKSEGCVWFIISFR